MSRFAGLYTLAEASERAHLAPTTIRKYASGRSDLIRGQDYLVRREGKWCKRLYFTERGLARLCNRAYRTKQRRADLGRVTLPEDVLAWSSLDDRSAIQRYRSILTQVLDLYGKSPCAQPGCPCIVHKLGLPQLDKMLEATLAQPGTQPDDARRRAGKRSDGG